MIRNLGGLAWSLAQGLSEVVTEIVMAQLHQDTNTWILGLEIPVFWLYEPLCRIVHNLLLTSLKRKV
jgi:hypothetical protein